MIEYKLNVIEDVIILKEKKRGGKSTLKSNQDISAYYKTHLTLQSYIMYKIKL